MNNEQMLIKCRDPRKCRFYAEYLNHKYLMNSLTLRLTTHKIVSGMLIYF